jgi:hypothetical protein
LARQIKFLGDSLGFRTSLTRKRAVISSIGYESEVWRVRLYGDINRDASARGPQKGSALGVGQSTGG